VEGNLRLDCPAPEQCCNDAPSSPRFALRLMNGAAKLSETYGGSVPDIGYQIVKVK
jgi:hypothetical protein